MPQITNRKLVGAMGATPTGQGTVYSAMLKACSTNRERAARVNDSERQKLQKATGVIDKHNRHNQWRCDQEIEKVRQSLTKLDAYQRVLREEYPVKNLISKTSPRGKNTVIKRKTAFSLLKSRAGGDSSKDGGTVLSTTSKPTGHDPNLSENNSHVSIPFNEHESKTVKFLQNSDTLKEENAHNERSSSDVIDIVTSANTITPQKPRTDKLVDQTKIDGDNIIICPQNATLDTLADKDQIQESNHTESETIQQKIDNNSCKSKPIRIPNEWFQSANNKDSNVVKTNDLEMKKETNTNTSSDDLGVIKVPEVTPEQQKREQRIKRLRAKWQAMMESRVCNRGFDMNTLHVDIERKLKRMDIDRRHREIKKSLLEESWTANERIIHKSKEKFDTVMDTVSKDTDTNRQ